MSAKIATTCLLAGSWVAMPVSAADPGSERKGWYVEGSVGQARLQAGEGTERDPDGGGSGSPTLSRFSVDYGDGNLFSAAFGLASGLGRVEVEFKQLDNTIQEPAATRFGSGEIQGQAALVNVWFGFGEGWMVQPYVGGGAGGIQQRLSGSEVSGAVAQLGLGADWQLGRRWSLTAGYRFLHSEPIAITRDNRDVTATYRGQLLSLGLRYTFGISVPPVPAAEPKPVTVVPTAVICSDGTDNDGDGAVDFPSDPGCESANDTDEVDPVGDQGTEDGIGEPQNRGSEKQADAPDRLKPS